MNVRRWPARLPTGDDTGAPAPASASAGAGEARLLAVTANTPGRWATDALVEESLRPGSVTILHDGPTTARTLDDPTPRAAVRG